MMFDSANEQLLQVLSAILIQINALQTVVGEDTQQASTHAISDGLRLLGRMAREALYVVRASLDDAPPAELVGTTLAEALSRLVEETAEMLGISSRVSFSGVDDEGRPREHALPPVAERVLYAIARESLYQVQQHSGVHKLRLALNYGPDDVQMSIEDDGNDPALSPASSDETAPASAVPPFAEAPVVLSIPLVTNMRQRIEQYGGTLEIAAAGEHGTRVLAHIPYASHTHATAAGADIPLLAEDMPAAATAANEVVRVLVVDGQAVTRAGLHRLLESYAGLQVVGQAADGVQAVSETLELGPQVVLMDAQLPNGQSLEALRQIKQLNLDTRVLLLSTLDREEYLYETLRAGADGYVLKDIAPDELAQAVRAVARGEVLIQPQLAGRLLSRVGKRAPNDALTTRELEVLRLLARGMRNKEIASRLFVSERTVNFHLANIYQKLNVSGRTEALSRALEQGLITA
ncbi:MAG: LuxR C-terminal-related transcriptional regulator [Chloroflexota bacterium]|nr:LuxR C-terminal-related transcriptional regulator [Chloroflexota bacterium]